jgi:Phosphotransferase enzyme family
VWTEPQWRATADAWIEEKLAAGGSERMGEFDQMHVRPWSTVMRVPTTAGDVFFKANAATLKFEAELVTLLAARRPDCVPPLLAADLERGWMLMADAGTRLRDVVAEERDLGRWLDVLSLYAGVQIDLSEQINDLLAAGVPDLRLANLPSLAEAMIDDLAALGAVEARRTAEAMPGVREDCVRLASFGFPETIEHDDLHDGQVFVKEGRYLLLDWGDACVTHPFFTLAVTLDGFIAWGVDDIENSEDTRPYLDAYLAPFAGHDGKDIVVAATLARRLGWLCRAVNGHQDDTEEDESTLVRLRMFLDGRP